MAFIRVDEDGALTRSSEFVRNCHKMKILVQKSGGDASSLNGKSEITNKTPVNVTRALIVNSSHEKKLGCLPY